MASTNVKILTEIKQRGKIQTASAITDTQEIVELWLLDHTERIQPKIQKNAYLKLLQYNIEHKPNKQIYKLQGKTKVFIIAPFDVDQDIIDRFQNAPTTTVAEALAMTPNKRVTLHGIASNVSPIKETPTWRRKDVTISDPHTAYKIRCKLWGDTADTHIQENTMLSISNVETDIYEHKVSVNTTSQTEIQEIDIIADIITGTADYEIVRFDTDCKPPEIITTTGMTLNLTLDQLQQLEPDINNLPNKLPLTANLTINTATRTVIAINTTQQIVKMPLLTINTNVKEKDIPATFLKEASTDLQAMIGKPMQYITLCINPGLMMSFDGTTEPCALASFQSIGKISPEENIVYSQKIEKLMKKVGISSKRMYIIFQDLSTDNVGYMGTTFSGLEAKK